MKTKQPRTELKASIDRAVKAEAKTRNEVTGKYAASIAGKWQQALAEYPARSQEEVLIPVCDIKILAASCLTQTKDRPKKGAKK